MTALSVNGSPWVNNTLVIWWWEQCYYITYRVVLNSNAIKSLYDDVIKWKLFLRYLPFVRGIHRWPVNSPQHKGQWRGALMFSSISAWSNRRWWFVKPWRPLWRQCNIATREVPFCYLLTSHIQICYYKLSVSTDVRVRALLSAWPIYRGYWKLIAKDLFMHIGCLDDLITNDSDSDSDSRNLLSTKGEQQKNSQRAVQDIIMNIISVLVQQHS